MQKELNFIGGADINGVSGGYLYNSHLLKMLRAKRYKIHYFNSKQSLKHIDSSLKTIVDSLIVTDIIDELALLKKTPILLYHLPPELNQAKNGNALTVLSDNMMQLVGDSQIVTTGRVSYDFMQSHYAPQNDSLHLIEPGLINNWRKKTSYKTSPKKLLVVASLVPSKGYETLLPTLAQLADLDWSLTFYGDNSFDPEFFTWVIGQIKHYGLEQRVSYGGVISQIKLNMEMVGADLLLQFSEFETYSMVTNEAIFAGLPILSSKTGNYQMFAPSGLIEYISTPSQDQCAKSLKSLLTDKTHYQTLRPVTPLVRRSWLQVADDFDALLEAV